ncbi:MAG TPA: hypothetical protein VN834_02850, partial [Candidatus Acidoferrum sp.]|nr:hypothetical protein [Candidatus Acidoferrum sp.]
MAQVNLDKTLEAGREAISRHAWREAFELLTAADQGGGLTAADLEGLAEAAWWNGRVELCISARERAFALHLEAGEPRRAALVAMDLAKDHSGRKAAAVGAAWFSQAQRLLQDEPVGVEHGFLSRRKWVQAHNSGDYERALEFAQQTLEIGTRFGNRDLMALGLQDQGLTLVAQGQFGEGMALLDEATVAALSGELRPLTTGAIYCNTISACEEIADYKRASDWTDAARRWCERQTISGFPGMCRVHRASVIRLTGAWQEAEQEARNAYEEVLDFKDDYAAEALYQIGEIRLNRGDLVEAGDAFRQAHDLGREPNPGLALLRLAEGDVAAAAASIKRGLAAEPQPIARSRMLPAQVSIALAAGDLATASAAAVELGSISATYTTPALRAHTHYARAAVALAEGNPDSAVRDLCTALAL